MCHFGSCRAFVHEKHVSGQTYYEPPVFFLVARNDEGKHDITWSYLRFSLPQLDLRTPKHKILNPSP